MKRIIINKSDIIKWLTQFVLSSVFVILACKFFVKGGSRGTIVGDILISCPLASAIGVILGDLSLYKGKKFIISTIPVVIVSAFIGVFVGLFCVDLVAPLYKLPYVGLYIAYAFCLAATTAPPIICYNAMTKSMRKYWTEVQEEESKKQKTSKEKVGDVL